MSPTWGLPPDTMRNLRSLDPLGEHGATPVAIAPTLDLDTALETATDYRGTSANKYRHRWSLVAATTAVMLAAAGLVFALYPRDHARQAPTASEVGIGQQKVIPPAYLAIASRAAPLAAGLSVTCGGIAVAVPMLAAVGNAELGTTASSIALRDFLADNPFTGMGSVSPHNWVLIADTGERLVFGQRMGLIGMGAVVVLKWNSGHYKAVSETGCGKVSPGPDVFGEAVSDVTISGDTLTVQWLNALVCGAGKGATERELSAVRVKSTPDGLHVLVVSKPVVYARPTLSPCAADVVQSVATVHRTEPVNGGKVIDDSGLPTSSFDVH